jgi:phenylpropionate dioxygenase-like ring-hydroxylating dioxygenase large terminal subunit
MEHHTQVELSRKVLAHIAAGTTDLAAETAVIPVSAFASEEILAGEVASLFRNYPQVVCLSCQIPDVGDFVTEDHGGVPIIVVRGKDGKVRAFLNVCRHRGARVAEGHGNAKRSFTCPYHAWSYTLEGGLSGVPHGKQAFPEMDKACYSLQSLPCEEKYGMIFVTPKVIAEALDVDDHLSGLGADLGAYGFESYHHYETRELTLNFNWKLVIDTFLEPYHFAVLHRDTVGPIFIPNLCLFDGFGLNLRETLPRRTIVELNEQPEDDWDLVKHTAMVYVLFPNTVVVMQADHLETWRVYPVPGKPDECVTCLDFYIPEPADTESAKRHWERNMDLTIRTVAEEDFPTMAGIQRGLLSGAQESVIIGRNEPALIHWEQACAKALLDNRKQ